MLSNIETKSEYHPYSKINGVQGKRVVIFGDAVGIGRATAALLVENGARVFIAVRDAAELTSAFTTLAETGNAWDGMVLDLCQRGAFREFFDLAERRLGRIDVVVNHLAVEADRPRANGCDSCQNQCLQEAIQRMQVNGRGHIINIGTTGTTTKVYAGLRRQASELGIRMTLIEPGAAFRRDPEHFSGYENFGVEDIARCVFESIAQPFVADKVLLRGKFQPQTAS